jgi:hypothetical protein
MGIQHGIGINMSVYAIITPQPSQYHIGNIARLLRLLVRLFTAVDNSILLIQSFPQELTGCKRLCRCEWIEGNIVIHTKKDEEVPGKTFFHRKIVGGIIGLIGTPNGLSSSRGT